MSVDFAEEGLLDGLEGEAREARNALLRELHENGVALDELRRAVAEERLPLLLAERELTDDSQYTPLDLVERTGLPLELLEAQWQALGLPRREPDERAFGERDLRALTEVKQFLDAGLPEEGVLEVARVIGESMARTSDAVRTLVGEAFAQDSGSERELGLRYAEAARALNPLVGPQLEYVYGLHLREGIRNDVVARATTDGRRMPGTQTVSVCFADLVGFTRLGEQLPADEVGRVAGRLATLATETLCPPVRMIKTIGDAAMLVSPDTDALLESALALVDAADEQGADFPRLRAGVARGEAIRRGGDWYGSPVNLASRVTGIARAASVLVTREALDDAADDRYRCSRVPPRRLKGISDPVHLYRVRRLEGDPEE